MPDHGKCRLPNARPVGSDRLGLRHFATRSYVDRRSASNCRGVKSRRAYDPNRWCSSMTLRHSLVIAFVLVIAVARPAVAQQRATVCNGGTVPVVAFSAYDMGLLTPDWVVDSTVVPPTKCGEVSFGTSVEFYLGFAVTLNGRLVGQPADNLPDSGMYRGEPLVQRAVKHVCLHRTGSTNYHYSVLEPDCATLGSGGPNRGQYVSVGTALFVRTGYDPRRELSGLGHQRFTVAPTATDPRLRLTDGFPAGIEAAREAENDALVQKLLEQFVKGMMAEASKIQPPKAGTKTLDQRLEDMDRAAVAADSGAPWALPRVPLSGSFDQQWYGKTMMISGTVSRVDVHGQFPTWITLYFKESPDDAIVICSAAPDIFAARLGRGYAPALVGRTVEVQGIVGGAMCDTRAKASIQVVMSNQLRIR